MAFDDGDIVKVNYTIKRDGEVFDTTLEKVAIEHGIFNEKRKYEPVVAVIGEGNFFKKVDEELKAMNVGERKIVKLEPKDAFGERKAELVSLVALKEFKRRNIVPYPGLIIDLNGMQGRVQSVSGGRVRVDFNHPLAGQTIEFELEVVEKVESKEKKAEALVERYFANAKEAIKIKLNDSTLSLEAPAKLSSSEAQRADFAKSAFLCLGVNKVAFTEVFEKEERDKGKKGADAEKANEAKKAKASGETKE